MLIWGKFEGLFPLHKLDVKVAYDHKNDDFNGSKRVIDLPGQLQVVQG